LSRSAQLTDGGSHHENIADSFHRLSSSDFDFHSIDSLLEPWQAGTIRMPHYRGMSRPRPSAFFTVAASTWPSCYPPSSTSTPNDSPDETNSASSVLNATGEPSFWNLRCRSKPSIWLQTSFDVRACMPLGHVLRAAHVGTPVHRSRCQWGHIPVAVKPGTSHTGWGKRRQNPLPSADSGVQGGSGDRRFDRRLDLGVELRDCP
jgi:hypothetical protein